MSVQLNKQPVGRFSKERIGILGIWFVLLLGIRMLLGFIMQDVWVGTLGAVGITFAIFYVALRYTRLGKYGPRINQVLVGWYKKRYVFFSIAAMLSFSSVLFFIDYGYAHHADKLVTIEVDEQDPLRTIVGNGYSTQVLRQNLQTYSYLDLLAITFASADKTLDGHYSKIVSYMLAEDIEVMVFLVFILKRKDIFSSPPMLAQT